MPTRVAHIELAVNDQWIGKHCFFGWHQLETPEIPNWHSNSFNDKQVKFPFRSWWLIPDFDSGVGDIKTIWEASRLDWLIGFSQRSLQGDKDSLRELNNWLEDWVQKNPPYLGPNWKCGQEASIRVMHLAMSALILDQVRTPQLSLLALVRAHLKRIAPTIIYAIAQDNNHGTSEAAALFIGGSWLVSHGDSNGEKWQKTGRKWLENRARLLIEEDGSFSQYSVNYHRVMLDTYSMVEVWRRKLELTEFSGMLYSRLALAADWLYQLTQSENGDAPNLGANDGARLLPLTAADYRDFRPSVQLAMALFREQCAWQGNGIWNTPLHWLGVAVPTQSAEHHMCGQFDKGGYSILRSGNAFLLFSYPRYRFRPSQADALHVDFWVDGQNLLRDGGTYSYNTDEKTEGYFTGTESHNSIEFDDRDQMPRVSRFLLGEWLKATDVRPPKEYDGELQCGAGYTDYRGASHTRVIVLSDKKLSVEDKVTGFNKKAVLRWRLEPGDWILEGNLLYSGTHCLTISADIPIDRISLAEGWESRYYFQKSIIPVLEIEVSKPGCLMTEFKYFQ
jgi:hypothetical protein